MSDAQSVWLIAYMVKLNRGEITQDCRSAADRVKRDFEDMVREAKG